MLKLYLSVFLAAFILPSFAQVNIPTGAGQGAATVQPIVYPFYVKATISPDYNRVFVPLIPTSDTSVLTMSADPVNIHISTTYMDELGRPQQSVSYQASPLKKDIVNVELYDASGNNSLHLLPYIATTDNGLVKSTAVAEDSVFYKINFPEEQVFYGKTNFDASPMNMVTKQMSPGNSWTGSSIGRSVTYRTNTVSDSVRIWTIGIGSEDDIPASTGIYAAGALVVTEMTGEDGKKTISYIDELGRKVLTKTQLSASPSTGHNGWLCSYMVYDEMNKLRFFISPKATEALNTLYSWNVATNPVLIKSLCYSYFYDNLGRVVTKCLPDKGKIYLVYDGIGRIVLAQDSMLRSSSQWQFIKYDAQNRANKAGLITLSGLSRDVVAANAASTTGYPTLSGTYTIMSEVYYDDYSWVSGSGSGLSSTLNSTDVTSTYFSTATPAAPDYAQLIAGSSRTRGMVTGTKTLVLGSSTNLYSVQFYDDRSNPIQTSATNITGGTDVSTVQYSYSGRVLRSLLSQQKSGSNAQTHKLLTNFTYDHMGRLLTIHKQVDAQANTLTATYTYNELGQLNTKTFGSSIETQNFSYNIRGWLKGINKDLAEGNTTTGWFGESLSYNYGFTQNQINGRIAGLKWLSKGDNKFRAYGYTYDNSGRITQADFTQKDGSGNWNTSDGVNFSVSNLKYDANGNIQTMTQRGLKLNASDIIDSLTYGYNGIGNTLSYVTDAKNDTTSRLGDFKEANTGSTPDYSYDRNGNITADNNKKISSISYNFMNQAQTITVTGKGTIAYTYDAKGTRLRKTVTEGATVTTTTYIAGFVYRNDTLQLAGQEEGRIRPSTIPGQQSTFVYDYFVKDHLGNTRMVLTAEQKTDTYPAATMETAQRTTENLIYAGIDSTAVTNPPGYPTDTYTTPHAYVAKVQAAAGSQSIGPSITLKVMAGDHFNIYTSSWYKPNGAAPGTPVSPLTPLLNALAGGISGASAATGGHAVTQTQLQSGSVLNTAATSFLSSQYVNFGKPKAYLNWILFDEQFNLVSSSSGFEQVSDSAWQTHVKTNLPVNANGYLYIYVSNATPNIPVYFDNLQVTHIHGALLQENHYYPHGLAMAGISDAAITTAAPNIYKANGSSSLASAEWADGSGLEMYETPARSYDAQIGRFGQTDPLMEQAANTSSYEFVMNNPVSDVDPMGLQGGNPYSQVQHLTDFQTGQPTWWGSMEGVAGMPSKAMDGGGGGSSGAYAVTGGFAFYGQAAGQSFSAFLYAINHPLEDGSWEFGVGQNKNGDVGYWQPYGIDGDMGIYNNVGVGTRFMKTEGEESSGNADNSTNSSDAHIGTGFQFTWGIGSGTSGQNLSVGEFGEVGNRVHQLFFTVTEPNPKNLDFMIDASAAVQLLIGYRDNGKLDVEGDSKTFAVGVDPASVSLNIDNLNNPHQYIVGVGPSIGIKASGSAAHSKTYAIPFIMPFLYDPILK